jgi:DedD protein
VAPDVPAPLREVAEVRPAEPKPEIKLVKTESKPQDKPVVKLAEAKPAARPEDQRAIAILEDKELDKPAAASNQKYIVQVAALGSQDKADELQARLKAAGVPSFTQKGTGPNGALIRVRVGPFSKEEGEKIRPKLVKLGLSGNVVPQ